MSHAYKALFNRVNESRKTRGLLVLSWKEFISKKDDPLVKVYRQKIAAHVEPDAPSKLKRPSATYDNASYQSIYEKYGV